MTPMQRIESVAISKQPFWIDNIELTNRCPFKCVMCPRTHEMKRPQGLMDFKLFQRIINQILDVNIYIAPQRLFSECIWLHHFGESLVHPDFHEFVIYAQKQGLSTGLSINPLMLSEKISNKLIEANPTKIYISLDGHDDASFEKIRGLPHRYEKSKENLFHYLDKKKNSNSNTQVIFSMINFPMNVESINKTVAYWKSVPGIDKVINKTFVNWDGSIAEINELGFNKEPPVFKDELYCTKPWSRMTINWDGTVVSCCYDHDKKYVLGDTNTQTLQEIWNGPAMQQLRFQFYTRNVTTAPCSTCGFLYKQEQNVGTSVI